MTLPRLIIARTLRCLWLPICWGACFLLPRATSAEDTGKRPFDLPADAAEKTLKLYSQQSGRALIMDAKAVKDVRTKVVRGEFTPQEALDRMLADTGLEAVEDKQAGSLAVRKISDRDREEVGQYVDGEHLPSKKKLTKFNLNLCLKS